jgi:hypothetical protein
VEEGWKKGGGRWHKGGRREKGWRKGGRREEKGDTWINATATVQLPLEMIDANVKEENKKKLVRTPLNSNDILYAELRGNLPLPSSFLPSSSPSFLPPPSSLLLSPPPSSPFPSSSLPPDLSRRQLCRCRGYPKQKSRNDYHHLRQEAHHQNDEGAEGPHGTNSRIAVDASFCEYSYPTKTKFFLIFSGIFPAGFLRKKIRRVFFNIRTIWGLIFWVVLILFHRLV